MTDDRNTTLFKMIVDERLAERPLRGVLGRSTDGAVDASTETQQANSYYVQVEDAPDPRVAYIDPALLNLFALGVNAPVNMEYEDDKLMVRGVQAGYIYDYYNSQTPSIYFRLAADSGVQTSTPIGSLITILGGTGIDTTLSSTTFTIALETPVTVANGGTGRTSITSGNIPIGAGTSAMTLLAPGSNGNILHVAGGVFTSGTLNLDNANLSGTLALAQGGANTSLAATGGSGFVLMQESTGANITVRALTDADIPNALTISGGTITNSPISGSTGSFTTLATSGAVTFNDAGADVDFRAEGDTDQNLIFLDASTDRVGIGTATPSTKFDVSGAVTFSPDANTTDTFAAVGISTFKHQSNTAAAAPTINLARTRAGNTSVDANDVLGILAFQGHDGATLQTTASISAIAQEDFDTAGEGTNLRFQVTRSGATSPVTIVDMTWGSVTIDGSLVADEMQLDPSTSKQITGGSTGLTIIQSSSDTTSPELNLYKSRGSIAAKSAVSSGDFIGTINFQSFGNQQQTRVQILSTATETHSSTVGGSDMKIYVTPNTTETLALAATFGQDLSLRVEGDFTADGDVHTFGDGSTDVAVNIFPSNTGQAGVQIGNGRGGDGLAYLDFVTSTALNYDARLIRAAGANGTFQIIHKGTGTFSIRNEGAAELSFDTNATARIRISSGGDIGFFGTAPGARQTYGAVTGSLSRAAFNTGTITTATVAQVLGALITDLKTIGIVA